MVLLKVKSLSRIATEEEPCHLSVCFQPCNICGRETFCDVEFAMFAVVATFALLKHLWLLQGHETKTMTTGIQQQVTITICSIVYRYDF